MPRLTALLAAACLAGLPALADEFGTLNPDEMTWQRFVERAEQGETDMVLCSMGYMLTKSGDHVNARKLFRNCAEAGWTGAMTWMGQLDDNGLGAPADPRAAAEWDRRAAELGDPVAKFNYGLALMRGHGVAPDTKAGRALVDAAAADGLEAAQRLRDAEYDLDVVTPDSDEGRYAPTS